MMTNHRQ